MSKICNKCGETKSVAEFSKDASKRDGLRGHCKECVRISAAAYYATNSEDRKAYTAAWRAANPEKAKASKDVYRATNSEKIKANKAARYAANPEKARAATAAYYAANTEKRKAASAAYRAANPVVVRSAIAAWQAANPEAVRVHRQNRRAREIDSGGQLSSGLAERLFKLQRGKCACGCKQPLGDDYHLDHIMPLALGGSNTDDNIQLLRSTCNLQKSRKHPIDFMRQRGYLL